MTMLEHLVANRKLFEALFLGCSWLFFVNGLRNIMGRQPDRGYALLIAGIVGIWIGATALRWL